jgi:hypothetical protein
MKFFALPNLSSQGAVPCNPTTVMPVVSYPSTKEKFREWCADKATNHCFYSPVEGLNPHVRVTNTTNPPMLMHGLVVDYDAQIDSSMIAKIPINGAAGLLPMWVSTTYSGGRRLLFEFEEAVLVDHDELTDRFLKLLAKELKVKNLLPGLDETSFKRTQYFELGRDWQRILEGNPIPSDLLSFLIFKAASAKQLHVDGPCIPIEAVAEEVERRWPGRIQGEFAVGLRTPLFWLDDGIDRIGAQVGDHGMICYSDRAGKSFLHLGGNPRPEIRPRIRGLTHRYCS